MKKVNLPQQIVLVTISLQFLLTGCSNYYKVISTPLRNNVEKAAKIDSLKQAGRIFILRNGDHAFLMKSLISDPGQSAINCKLETLKRSHQLHLTNGRGSNMRYKKDFPEDIAVLNEVHVYIAADSDAVQGKYTLALDKIKQIEVIEKDKQRTTASYILGGVGIAAGVGVVIVAIAGASFHMDMSGLRLGGP